MTENYSYLEQKFGVLCAKTKKYSLPLLTAVISGLSAYLFCFTNKLEIMDDLLGMFYSGLGVSSGRWGLELLRNVFPQASMPWLNGIFSLVLIAVSVCLIIDMFEIKSRMLQFVLAAVMAVFPSQTCTYAYMFAAAIYAFALFLSVLSAKLIAQSSGISGKIAGAALLVLSVGIYQVYLAVTVSLLLVYIIFLCMHDEAPAEKILKKGAEFILLLFISAAVYYVINIIALKVTHSGYNEYASGNLNSAGGALAGIAAAYKAFAGFFFRGYYDLVSNPLSLIAHLILTAAAAAGLIIRFKNREKADKSKLIIALVCVLLLPLGINCVRVISSQFHNLMLFSFTSVYLLAAVIADRESKSGKTAAVFRDITAVCLALITCVNIVYANKVYLKMYMQVEQAGAFYTSVISDLMSNPDFNEDSGIAFVGTGDAIYGIPEVDTENIAGVQLGVIGTYSQENFIRYFVGPELKIADLSTSEDLAENPEVEKMPNYPYFGSVKKVGEWFVVKTG